MGEYTASGKQTAQATRKTRNNSIGHRAEAPGPTTAGMARREREDLIRHVRRLQQHAKLLAKQRSATLRAQFERQLDTTYEFNTDAVWKQAMEAARAIVAQGQREVAERCKVLGIPARFAPGLQVRWYPGGEQLVAQHHAGLRRLANAQIDALEQAAKVEIDRVALGQTTALLAGGLTSAEAQAFLRQMPEPDALMPALDLRELEGKLLPSPDHEDEDDS
jgi:hypothetical protein